LLAGRQRRMTTSLTKRRMTSQAKADVQESLDSIEQYKKEIEKLDKERLETLADVEDKWQEILNKVTEIPVTPYKKDILMEIFGVAWFPYYLYQDQDRNIELAAYSH
jgi:predicted metalloprotease